MTDVLKFFVTSCTGKAAERSQCSFRFATGVRKFWATARWHNAAMLLDFHDSNSPHSLWFPMPEPCHQRSPKIFEGIAACYLAFSAVR